MQCQFAFCRVINIMSHVNSAKPRSKAKVPQCSVCQQLRTGPHEGWEHQGRTKVPASWTDILTQTRQTIRELSVWMGMWVIEVQTESRIKPHIPNQGLASWLFLCRVPGFFQHCSHNQETYSYTTASTLYKLSLWKALRSSQGTSIWRTPSPQLPQFPESKKHFASMQNFKWH